ncbi:hypothetical protein ARMGADRAFT_1084359 [Armillaria gallica]|uniref:Uncharacterized protein n=1 Tax=Armillaria gallica TaxID=47427 RepID=A0A2H3DKL9_ARMGA|nr:hypothetical protein ARMGADRAFT_1084359 [Armillaria gallica]
MAENISLAEIKSLLLHILNTLNVVPATTGTASTMIMLKELSDNGNSAVLTELSSSAFATIPKDTLVLIFSNNPPPHEPNLYYVVTQGLAVGVIQGIANVMPLM